MPKMSIKRSVHIGAEPSKVFNTISDFNHWQAWSPWLIMEPNAKVTIRSDAKYYEWEGGRVGAGNMKVIKEEENSRVDYDLMFLKPWKSQAKVSFIINPDGDGAEVTWTMDSSLPFFLFWMKKMTEAFVGMDYERGLNMLKEYIESGEISSKLTFEGESQFGGCHYVGISTVCSKEQLGVKMKEDLTSLSDYIKDKQDKISGPPFSIYSKWDMVKDQISYTSGIPVNETLSELPAGIKMGQIPATKVYTVKHTGPYHHLGNAWSTLNNMARGKEFKWNKKIHPFEVYLNDPDDTKAEQLETAVHFPVK